MELKQHMIPRYLQVAHWIYEQNRMISAREAAEIFGGSAWSMEQTLSKIRSQVDIVIYDEKIVPSKGGKQYLMRIIYIYPYWLDTDQRPHRKLDNSYQNDAPLTWKDLLSNKWPQLVVRHKNEKN
ncbi:hypothetical protein OKS68_20665 [Aeromonas veronii]|uniref:hypothetical protein n=1 Tax=Aeromonas veronii TaxID=654 RepID=UPI00226CA9C1|nr:hypothetical protein [Aeromonas veronii]MCX9134870.1 hypothetical protein [Aeromonas veronii]